MSESAHQRQLYKYVAPDRVESVLGRSTLRISQASALNDLFEATWKGLELLDTEIVYAPLRDDVTWGDLIYEVLSDRLSPYLRKLLRLPAKAILRRIGGRRQIAESLAEGVNAVLREKPEAADLLSQLARLATDRLKRLGVICFSSTPTSDLMWAHYAGNHQGIVVEYEGSHPTFLYKDLPQPMGRVRSVRYVEELPYLTLRNFPIVESVYRPIDLLFLTKLTRWQYEREQRMVLPLALADEERELSAQGPLYLKHIPTEAVSGIILGVRTTGATEQQVLSTLRDKYPNESIRVRRAVLHSGRLGLSKPIDWE